MRPRIRSLKPEFFQDEALYDAEHETGLPLRLAYQGLWCMADREGRFEWRPRALKANILPFDEADFSRVLDALGTRGWLVKYASPDGREYGWIRNFRRHQSVNNKEAPSELPAPTPSDVESYTSTTREAREAHANGTRAGKDQAYPILSEPIRTEPSRAPRKVTRENGHATWLTPFGDAWFAQFGGKAPFKQLAAALKEPVDRHGPDTTLRHWRSYLARTEAQYASPSRFASTFAEWGKPEPMSSLGVPPGEIV